MYYGYYVEKDYIILYLYSVYNETILCLNQRSTEHNFSLYFTEETVIV